MEQSSGISLKPIPQSDRHANFWSMFWLWAGGNILLATFMVGSYFSESLGFWPTIVVCVTANLAACALCAVSSQRGAKYGMDEILVLRPTFGFRGAYYGAFVLIFINFGWIGLLSSMTGTASLNAVTELIGPSASFTGDFTLYAVGGGILIPMLLVMSSPKTGFYLSSITVPILGGFSLYILYELLSSGHMEKVLSHKPTGEFGWAFAIETCVVWAVAWQPYLGAWNKFAKTEKAAYWGSFWGLGLIAILFSITGGVATLATGEIDPAIWTVKLELGFLATIIIILGTITTCSLLLYAGVMALLSLIPKLPYKLATMLVALPSLVFVYDAQLQSLFGIILLFVGLLAGPYWAVVMADYFFLRKEKISVEACYEPTGIYSYTHGVNYVAVAAQLVGMVLWMWLGGWLSGLSAFSFSSGQISFQYLTATVPSMIVSAAVYVTIVKWRLRQASPSISRAYPEA
ncbi:cytosine permease [Kordiimonas sp. SCSIO 12603]|uniref:purine-cytosine permease family protein n=1 Tax=Kordiimonas sp. SCSIO 12603 TaxID=2829596 RepID=UPI0021064252|nr:cytosine permease [Kordiimonas sp. SCSIO 12603]UTW60356.1 cytosine permease [Kordiimonas sp. SCSIO 12603]